MVFMMGLTDISELPDPFSVILISAPMAFRQFMVADISLEMPFTISFPAFKESAAVMSILWAWDFEAGTVTAPQRAPGSTVFVT